MKAPPRILVVDDDPDWREALRLQLEALGYLAFEAASGEEALASLAERTCDVMLLDLYMPGMDGEQVALKLPAGAPPVVFLTAAPAQAVGSALGSGPHYYLPKEAGPEALQLLLQSLMAN